MQTLFDAKNTGGPDPSNPTGLTYAVSVTPPQAGFAPASPATGTINPVVGTLTIYDGGTPLPTGEDESVGGFDDEGGGGLQRLDVGMTPNAPGCYELEYPAAPVGGSGGTPVPSAGEINIYSDPGGTQLVAPDTPITPAALQTLYIQGEAMSQTDGDIQITLYYVPEQTGGGSAVKAEEDDGVDTVGPWVIRQDGSTVSGATTTAFLGQVIDLRAGLAPLAPPPPPWSRASSIEWSTIPGAIKDYNAQLDPVHDEQGQVTYLGDSDYAKQEIKFVWWQPATGVDVTVTIFGDSYGRWPTAERDVRRPREPATATGAANTTNGRRRERDQRQPL